MLKRKDIYIILTPLVFFLVILIITWPLSSKSNPVLNKSADKSTSLRTKEGFFPYDLTNPSQKFKLPHYLDEISGISYIGFNELACIQDEEGTIFIFDYEEEKVTEEYKFGKDKDYEDLEIIDNSAYILQSNGTIIKIKDFLKTGSKVHTYKTQLSRENDTEGLAFDPETNSLLIACKGSPHLDEKETVFKGKKAIYGFDLYSKRLSAEPVYTIDTEYLKRITGTYGLSKQNLTESKEMFDPLEGDESFQPSGIAIHPLTREIYIISSVGKMLIVLNRQGAIVASKKLNKKVFKQPEGICFSPNGDLFISNESKEGRGNILRFDYLM